MSSVCVNAWATHTPLCLQSDGADYEKRQAIVSNIKGISQNVDFEQPTISQEASTGTNVRMKGSGTGPYFLRGLPKSPPAVIKRRWCDGSLPVVLFLLLPLHV